MAANRIMRRRRLRRALFLGAVAVGLLTGLAACGGGGGDGTTDREADVGVLNEILARQLAAVDAYGAALPLLHGEQRTLARGFRAQEQEHVDATTKTLRGLDGEADPPPETIDAEGLENPEDALDFLYELESATIDAELNAVARLTISWPRPLITAMAANQAQRLVLIRRALGAAPAESVPEAFETGETAAPQEMMQR
ncbi:MAG TPA: ferritin-like domain-containing protein [Solirubrobacterales bacterium]